MRNKLGFDWSFILARLFEKSQAQLEVQGIPVWLPLRQRSHGWFRLEKVRGCKVVLPFLCDLWLQRVLYTEETLGVPWKIRMEGIEVFGVGASHDHSQPASTDFAGHVTAKLVSG